MAKTVKDTEISIIDIHQGNSAFALLGTSPMIFNCVSAKAWRALLGPEATGRRSRAERAQAFKHNPIEEYRDSVYRWEGDDRPTRLKFPCPAFKGAMATAALDLKGVAKTEIGRLCWVEGYMTDVWGVPELLMSVVRSADMAKTPDIRTRAILREWCCVISVNFVEPKLNANTVAKLLAAAGITVGIGDFRQEKGKGSFGQFRLVPANDKDLARIQKAGGRKAQDAALDKPSFYDAESAEMFSWHFDEVITKKSKVQPQIAEAAE
jgi:hypothetical protein